MGDILQAITCHFILKLYIYLMILKIQSIKGSIL